LSGYAGGLMGTGSQKCGGASILTQSSGIIILVARGTT
jgi:hypothetical protein